MDHRKIMVLGKSSFVVSLPKEWMRMNNLDRGNTVAMDIQKDKTLLIYPTGDVRTEGKEIHLVVEADESNESITRRIISSYLDGYTRIKLTSGNIFSTMQHKAIRKIVGTLYMMILESEANSVTLQTLVDESKASVNSSIERMHIITYSMCRDTLNAMLNRDKELALSVIPLEDDVDQLMFFLLRLIRVAAINPSIGNQLGLDPLDCLDYQSLVSRIERIADHVTSMAQSLVALITNEVVLPVDLESDLLKTSEAAFNSYDMAVESFLSKDITNSDEIIDKEREVIKAQEVIMGYRFFQESNYVSSMPHIFSIIDVIRKISHHAASIAEITIDRAYKSGWL
jgi:phosphate uptake regulator